MKNTISHIATTEEKRIWDILEQVKDPEVPVLSVIDLGIIREVKIKQIHTSEKNQIHIVITPTYSGCPAIDMINMDIRIKLIEHGYRDVIIEQKLSPAWTTDWMTEEGKKKLK